METTEMPVQSTSLMGSLINHPYFIIGVVIVIVIIAFLIRLSHSHSESEYKYKPDKE